MLILLILLLLHFNMEGISYKKVTELENVNCLSFIYIYI